VCARARVRVTIIYIFMCNIICIVSMTHAGKESMLRLAGRMVTSFCTSIGASTAHAWTNLPSNGSEEIKVMTRKYTDESGSDRPSDVVLSTATSFWLPIPPKRVFEFLRNENSRSQVCIFTNFSAF
jgi:homeobox-leucine zipper protein